MTTLIVRDCIEDELLEPGCLLRLGYSGDPPEYHSFYQVECVHGFEEYDNPQSFHACVARSLSWRWADGNRISGRVVNPPETIGGAGCKGYYKLFFDVEILEVIMDPDLIAAYGFPVPDMTILGSKNPFRSMIMRCTRSKIGKRVVVKARAPR